MMLVTPSLRRRLYLTGAMPVLMTAFGASAFAQVEIIDAQTAGIATSTAATDGTASDVTTTSDSTFILTGAGPALTLNSDNALISGGAITITDVDDSTGILVDTSGGALTGSLSVTGNITIDETFAPTDTDDDLITDGKFAEGTGRTGILISGADTFTGPVDVASTIRVEGNESAGIRIMQAAGMTNSIIGDLSLISSIAVTGDNARGIDLQAPVTGNVAIGGAISTLGEGASAIEISGPISERLTISGSISNTGNRTVNAQGLPTRQLPFVRDLYDSEDTLEASNAVNVSANVDGGIYFSNVRNDEGVAVASSVITQIGTAPAVQIAGDGASITIGRLSDIEDTTDAEYNANLLYSVLNEAAISGTSVLDDLNATGMRIADANLTSGFNNLGQIRSQTYRSPNTGDTNTNAADPAALSTALDVDAGAIIPELRNAGTIAAASTEATGLAYADADNPLAPNAQIARGINIDATGNVALLENVGTIGASVMGRNAEAIAIMDESGTLATLNNQGFILVSGNSSDATGAEDTTFKLVAIDVSANTSGFNLTQSTITDDDPDDEVSPETPVIIGDIQLGSGTNTLDIQTGSLAGDITFGSGSNALTIGETAEVRGALNNAAGLLTLDVSGTLRNTSAAPVNATTATFSPTSTFRPYIDGSTDGAASTLIATGGVTFEDGASISPILANVIGGSGTFTIVDAGTLTVGNTDISSLQTGETSFLYTSEINRPAGTDTLQVTLTQKDVGDLGLDAPQIAAFASTFNAITSDTDLGAAFVAITDEAEFNAAYNQLMPEFGAAVARFIHSNADGATGAVATHLNNARLSDERPGGAWIEEFAFFADRELTGLSESYKGYGFGFTGGFDTQVGPFHTAGVNFGFAATEVEDTIGFDTPLTVQTLQAGVYAGYEQGKLGVDMYLGGGFNDLESARSVRIGDYRASTQANWSGTHINAALTAGYDFDFGSRYYMRPALSVSYLSLTEDGYEENGADAVRFLIDERTSEMGSATALLNFGAKFGDDRVWWTPAVRFGVINEFEGSGIATRASYYDFGSSAFDTANAITLAGQDFPDTGVIFGLSIAAGSKYSSFGFDYDADIRDGYNRHIARLVLRLMF